MGFSYGIQLDGASSSHYAWWYPTIWSSVQCNGNETSLSQCQFSYNDTSSCGQYDYSKVVWIFCAWRELEDELFFLAPTQYNSSQEYYLTMYSEQHDTFGTFCGTDSFWSSSSVCSSMWDQATGSDTVASTSNPGAYGLSSDLPVWDIVTEADGNYSVSLSSTCGSYTHSSDVLLQCTLPSNSFCADLKESCLDNYMCCSGFCLNHRCVDTDEEPRPYGFTPCYENGQCETDFCDDPGIVV